MYNTKIVQQSQQVLESTKMYLVVSEAQLENVVARAFEKVMEQYIKKPDKKVTRKNAAEQLHVDLSTLNRWAKDGYLVPIHVGTRVWYWQSSIDKILGKDTDSMVIINEGGF